ncbi:MAG: response regulator [bacterium]
MVDQRYSIAIIEDDPQLREYLEETVAADDRFDIAFCAGLYQEAASKLDRSIDLYLIDLQLPDGNGLNLITKIREDKEDSQARILVFTVFGDQDSVLQSMQAGADGYLLKDSLPQSIVNSIMSTLRGEAPISAAAAAHLLRQFRKVSTEEKIIKPDVSLTPRETQLLEYLSKGFSYRETAEYMEISTHTVGDYVKAIYRKLSVNSRSEAIFEAVQSGLIRLKD